MSQSECEAFDSVFDLLVLCVCKATPDLLKGQRELPDQPDEETAKLVMVNYLKDG